MTFRKEKTVIVSEYYENGALMSRRHYDALDNYHNINGPAFETWYENGQKCEVSYAINGKWHGTNRPASISYYESGELRFVQYYQDGMRHNTDAPAFQFWYENGQIKEIHYSINDKYHRIDGPAKIRYKEDGTVAKQFFYLDGEVLSEQEFWHTVKSEDSLVGKNITINGIEYRLERV